jgi:hypothetical protein
VKEQLEAEVARLESELAAAKSKLEGYLADVPAEFHTITQEIFDKIKSWFTPATPAADPAPAAAPTEPPAAQS